MSKVAKQFHYQVKSLNTGWARNQISPSTSIHTVSQQIILNFVESLLAYVLPSCLPRTYDKFPFKLLSSLMPQPSFFSSILSYIFQLLRGLKTNLCYQFVDTTAMLGFPTSSSQNRKPVNLIIEFIVYIFFVSNVTV